MTNKVVPCAFSAVQSSEGLPMISSAYEQPKTCLQLASVLSAGLHFEELQDQVQINYKPDTPTARITLLKRNNVSGSILLPSKTWDERKNNWTKLESNPGLLTWQSIVYHCIADPLLLHIFESLEQNVKTNKVSSRKCFGSEKERNFANGESSSIRYWKPE